MTSRHPGQFNKRWLRFDPERPTRPRLLRGFVVAVAALLMFCAFLMMLTAR